jgi:ribosomal protein S18 acetylase RimI-like enzyme
VEQSVKHIDYAEESWNDVWGEIVPLAAKHFDECKPTHGHAPFNFDFEGIKNLADAGLVHVTTARDRGDLVGYIVNLVMPRHTLFNRSFASHMGWYVKPEYRVHRVGMKLLQESESLLKGKVSLMLGMHTSSLDCSKLFERLGYEKSEINYMKWID